MRFHCNHHQIYGVKSINVSLLEVVQFLRNHIQELQIESYLPIEGNVGTNWDNEFVCYLRYMNDKTAASSNIEIMLTTFIIAHSAINFSLEKEVDHTLVFLDLDLSIEKMV